MTSNDKKKKNRKTSTDNTELYQSDLNSYLADNENSEMSQDYMGTKSLAKVKNELQTMLDLMGPETPQFRTTSSEADNDTSTGGTLSTNNIRESSKKRTENYGESSPDQEDTSLTETVTAHSSVSKNTSVLVELPSSQSRRNDEIADLEDVCHNIHTTISPNIPQALYSQLVPQYIPGNMQAETPSYVNPMSNQYAYANEYSKKKRGILDWFGYKSNQNSNGELYKVKIKQDDGRSLPRRLTFELADEVHPTNQPLYGPNPMLRPLKGRYHNVSQPLDYQDIYREEVMRGPPCTATLCPHTTTVPHEKYCPQMENSQHYHHCNLCLHANAMPEYSDTSCQYMEEFAEPHPQVGYQNVSRPFEQSIPSPHHDPQVMPDYNQNFINNPRNCLKNPSRLYKNTDYSRPGQSPDRKFSKKTKSFGQNYAASPTHIVDENLARNSESLNRNNDNNELDSRMKPMLPGQSYRLAKQCKCNKENCICSNVKSLKVFGQSPSNFGIPSAHSSPYDLLHCESPGIDQQRISYYDTSGATRVDVYYFDHGNAGFYRTTDLTPAVATEAIAEKTETYTLKFWAEIFGTIHIGFAFVTSFILQLLRFILYSFFRPLVVGIVQLASDYFFKPALSTCFNSLIQPFLIFSYNIASSFRDLCDPMAEALGYYVREIAVLVRAVRLVEVNKVEHGHCRRCNSLAFSHSNRSSCCGRFDEEKNRKSTR